MGSMGQRLRGGDNVQLGAEVWGAGWRLGGMAAAGPGRASRIRPKAGERVSFMFKICLN